MNLCGSKGFFYIVGAEDSGDTDLYVRGLLIGEPYVMYRCV